jgi:hypothetical protein
MNNPESHESLVVTDQEASGHIDLYALPPEAIKNPPLSLFKALGQIGPGLVLAGSIVGTGELINTTGLGAEHGYILLWLIILNSSRQNWVVMRSRTARRRWRRSTRCRALDSARRGSAGAGWS